MLHTDYTKMAVNKFVVVGIFVGALVVAGVIVAIALTVGNKDDESSSSAEDTGTDASGSSKQSGYGSKRFV